MLNPSLEDLDLSPDELKKIAKLLVRKQFKSVYLKRKHSAIPKIKQL